LECLTGEEDEEDEEDEEEEEDEEHEEEDAFNLSSYADISNSRFSWCDTHSNLIVQLLAEWLDYMRRTHGLPVRVRVPDGSNPPMSTWYRPLPGLPEPVPRRHAGLTPPPPHSPGPAALRMREEGRLRRGNLREHREVRREVRDVEEDGAPSAEQTASRVSYMLVPYFLGKQEFTERACDRVVGLQIVVVEYLNEQNVLVTVLAARPRDYNPLTGKVDGAHAHRYYYLHPGQHDCR
jgi:hypothetical protein